MPRFAKLALLLNAFALFFVVLCMEKIINHLSSDARLAGIIPLIPFPAATPDRNLYTDLLDSIVSQQLSVKAATTIYGRFLQLFEDGFPHPDQVLALSTDQLRAVGLSQQKASYMQNVARHWISEDLMHKDWHTMSDEDILADLTQIKGVGKWTVQMILMFTLHRPDVFPADDLGIQQGMIRLYELTETGRPLHKRMHDIAEAWRPYRSYACYYLWRWKDAK